MIARAVFAVPGALETPTGGYGYARRLLAGAKAVGLDLVHWPLPGGWPVPSEAALAETARRLAAIPSGWPVMIDGLALGGMGRDLLDLVDGPLVALCHHPLALETGLAPAEATRLAASERAALARAARVVTTSRATAATLAAEYGVPMARITVAPPGTDPAPPARGSGGPGVAILSVGTLVPRKGHDVLIGALARLADLDWRLTIVGADDRDPGHLAWLRAQVAALGLEGRVSFAGAADAAALALAYDGADLFALASHHEGFGMVYAEAIARGLPVVGTDAGAVAEATLGAALLVPPGDEAALAAALRGVIADPAARRALAARALGAAPRLPRWEATVAAVAGALAAVEAEIPGGAVAAAGA